jgi:hypothetical protein
LVLRAGLITVCITALALVGCSGGGEHTVRVHLYVDTEFTGSSLAARPGDPCTPYASSVRFIVKNADGETVATQSGELSEGTLVGGDVDPDTGVNCDVGSFGIPEVPDSDFYELQAEGVPGSVTSSAEELEQNDWTLDIIGDP